LYISVEIIRTSVFKRNTYIHRLNNSCVHTLANKRNSLIRKFFTKYSNSIQIKQVYNYRTIYGTKQKKVKVFKILSYQVCKIVRKELRRKALAPKIVPWPYAPFREITVQLIATFLNSELTEEQFIN
jgi:hypothetical protein